MSKQGQSLVLQLLSIFPAVGWGLLTGIDDYINGFIFMVMITIGHVLFYIGSFIYPGVISITLSSILTVAAILTGLITLGISGLAGGVAFGYSIALFVFILAAIDFYLSIKLLNAKRNSLKPELPQP